MRFTHYSPVRKFAVAGTAAAFAAGTALMAVPAGAVSGSLVMVCTTPIGDQEFVTIADTDLPATLQAGQSVPVMTTTQVTIPAALSELAYGFLGARTVEGTAVVKSTLNGVALPDSNDTIPNTPVPASGDLTVVLSGPGAAFAPTEAGTYTTKLASYTASIKFKKADNSDAIIVDTSCVPKMTDPAQDLTVDTVAVTAPPVVTPPVVTPPVVTPPVVEAQATKTKVKAKYIKKQKMIKAVVKITSTDKGATGKAKVTVKKGKKTVKKITVKVKNGKAVAKVKKVSAKGKYKIIVKYLGDDTHKKSKGKSTVRVK